jgi:oligogalacturonide transport system permease protein
LNTTVLQRRASHSAARYKRFIKTIITYAVIFVIGVVLLYPIIWMFSAAFKSNDEIFGSTKLLPNSFSFQYFIEGWQGVGNTTYTDFFWNSFVLVIPTVLLTLLSCSLVAYGFARFRFPYKKALFALLIATLMLPNSVIIIPRYTLFNRFGWLDSYLPFWVPALLACYPFFIFMLVQFMRGLPRDLDESAYIDGCSTFRVFWQILLPLLKPAMFSAALFQFLWTYNDYFNSLIYINSVQKYTISLALRLSLDSESVVVWGKMMAMTVVAVLPLIILFFIAQKYFVEGIATSGMKG